LKFKGNYRELGGASRKFDLTLDVDVAVRLFLCRWASHVWGRDGFQKTFSTLRTSLLPAVRFSVPTLALEQGAVTRRVVARDPQ
jgi:hypothetical protein